MREPPPGASSSTSSFHLAACPVDSCGGHVARKTAEEVEHALAPGRERILRREQLPWAHHARPLEYRKQGVIGVRRQLAADVSLPLEQRLHRLEAAAQALERVVLACTQLFEGMPASALGHGAEVALVERVDALVDVRRQDPEHQADQRAVDPGVERVGHAAADVAAEKRLLRIARLEVLGDLPGIAHHGLAVANHRHRLASRERDRRLVAHAHRPGLEGEALVHERHPRAPREQAVAPVVPAAQFPEDDHAALLPPSSPASWLAGRALMRRSFCSARSRAALRNAWSRPGRYCGGQYCGRCWYHAEAWSVKYGLARCGRASATRSALPAARSVFTWSGVVTAPTVMVAIPTSLRTQSAYGAWYIRPYTGRW